MVIIVFSSCLLYAQGLILAEISAGVTVVVGVGVARVSVASVPGWVLIERKKKKAS